MGCTVVVVKDVPSDRVTRQRRPESAQGVEIAGLMSSPSVNVGSVPIFSALLPLPEVALAVPKASKAPTYPEASRVSTTPAKRSRPPARKSLTARPLQPIPEPGGGRTPGWPPGGNGPCETPPGRTKVVVYTCAGGLEEGSPPPNRSAASAPTVAARDASRNVQRLWPAARNDLARHPGFMFFVL